MSYAGPAGTLEPMTTDQNTDRTPDRDAGHDFGAGSGAIPQITLPGQAATVQGPLDMSMMYVMHHAFRRDLTALAAATGTTPLGAADTWAALERRWELFSYVLHHHHHGEDEGYWPLLLERVAEADRHTLEAMEAEHALIGPALERCAHGFRVMARGGTLAQRQHLHENLVTTLEHLDAHLAHEERDALPLLHAHLSPEEDERIEEKHFRAGVPLRKVLQLVPWAMHEVPEREREVVLGRLGSAYRLVWRLTRPAFERGNRIALRYAR